MAIRAWLQSGATDGRTSREARLHVLLEAKGAADSGAAVAVTVHNISLTGMLLECRDSIAVDELLTIDLPRAPDTKAVVVWTSGQLHGCKFLDPLSQATLSAAQLRSAVGHGVAALPEADQKPGESFGHRLQGLRKQHGLTLAELAAQLGVSKPTVWAWEQGRSSPSPDRYEKIADVLGTTVSALRMGRDDDATTAVVERSRRQIAEAYSVSADCVRIMIEL